MMAPMDAAGDDLGIELMPIGRVVSSLAGRENAPRQPDEDAPPARIELEDRYAAGLEGVCSGDEVILITWLDRGDRDVLSVHPRGDRSRPPQGVFSTRSPDRPNPIGLHHVEVTSIDGATFSVAGLEAIDGTPVLDVKPALSSDVGER
jgi:tRNA-Thr(GGU) m(6)t(6)A37 methyltransferase TsaA